jgi:malonyl-CoA/methylmalonyl-CoA synthetase
LARLDALGQSGQLALVDAGGGSPFQAVIQRARQLAGELRAAGLEGARIGLSSTPDRNWVEGFWAILLAGGSVVPISPLHPAPERNLFLRQSAARAHLVSPPLAAAMPEGPVPRLVFDAGRLLSSPPNELRLPQRPGADASTALLLYTSGTTGQPKGVPLSHQNVWACVQTLIDDWQICAADRLIHALPLHHVHGICVALLCSFCAGAATELLPRYDAARVLECAAHASVLMSVPTQHKRLVDYLDGLEDPALRQRYQGHLRGLRLITSGSAKLPEQLGRRLQALSGQYPLERYGMTEVGIVIGNPLEGERRAGSCGRPLPGVDLRIVDEHGQDLAAGQPGEIWIRGASVFEGYDRDPLATRAVFDSGYFKSGDTAQWTADGFVEILGRSSVDIIKSGGYKLSAIELEEQLRAHPWVQDVAVVGLPDETWGERAVAVVVPSLAGREALERGNEAASEQLRDWLKQRVAGYQVPKSVVWREDLPRNAMGKVQKPELLRSLPETARP